MSERMQRSLPTLKPETAKLLSEAVKEALSDALWHDAVCEAVDKFIEARLEGSRCWIDFSNDGADALIGVGPGDVALSMDVTISNASYADVPEPYPNQMQHIREQITGIDKFIAQVNAYKQELATDLAAKEATLAAREQQ
jgi:hypothetical protein